MKKIILIIILVLIAGDSNRGSWVWFPNVDVANAASPGFEEFVNNLSAMGKDEDGNFAFLKCPSNWDIPAIEAQCKIDNPDFVELNPFMVAANCVPKCGKYPGDRPDIGAFEYIEGQTSQRPWGIWEGRPLNSIVKPDDPNIDPPSGFKEK